MSTSSEPPAGRGHSTPTPRHRPSTVGLATPTTTVLAARPAPLAVEEMLVRDEHARIHQLALMFMALLPIAGILMLSFDAPRATAVPFAVLLAISFVGTILQHRMTSESRNFNLALLFVIASLQSLTLVAATAYFGLFSPIPIVAVLLIRFLALGNYSAVGITVWSIYSLGRIILLTCIVLGAFADPGIIHPVRLTTLQLCVGEALVEAILAITFVTGRTGRRTTLAHITHLTEKLGEAARRELDLATRIQTSILPRDVSIRGFEVSANMSPVTEVGGDYYDVRPALNGSWIGIGDVSGHGITAGLIMMMVQTAVATVTADEGLSVVDVVERVNRVVYDNVFHRLRTRDFVTFQMLRLRHDGTVGLAGLHEPILIYRAASRELEALDLEGMWLGIQPSVRAATRDRTLRLERGDTILLHTDGVTEAKGERSRFGLERLGDAFRKFAHLPVDDLRASIEEEVSVFAPHQDDDRTVVVVRFVS